MPNLNVSFLFFLGMCVGVCAYTHIHVKASSCQVSSLIDHHSSFLRQGISLKLEFAYLARMVGKQASGIFLSLSPRLWDCKNFLCGSGELTSSLHAFMTNMLLTETYP